MRRTIFVFKGGAEVRGAAEQARAAGAEAYYEEIESLNGHDSFLKGFNEARAAVGLFLDD